MAFKYKDIQKDDGLIKSIERQTTTYSPMITRKNSLYHKHCNLSNLKIVTYKKLLIKKGNSSRLIN